MPIKTNRSTAKKSVKRSPGKKSVKSSLDTEVQSAIAWLRSHSTKRTLEGMARYAIPSDNALGVSVGDIRQLGKRLGRNQELALALWSTGFYEARMLTAFVAEPERITAAQMDRWCRDFDSWAICDTLCFHLFDRTPQAWTKAVEWCSRRDEFGKRAAFALMASLSGHDKAAPDSKFLALLPLIEEGAHDDRNFVKKAVNWALRSIGKRNKTLNAAAVAVARRLAASNEPAARWVGKDALRELTNESLAARLSRQN
jgi:3-methyladenine DNA glycosylase AlkD